MTPDVSVVNAPELYRLNINFQVYTDNDPDFKNKLIALMVDNIRELQASLRRTIKNKSILYFKKASHKASPTLKILNDKTFSNSIEEIVRMFLDKVQKDIRDERIRLFNAFSERIIKSLEAELNKDE